jgi:hypothetical protein
MNGFCVLARRVCTRSCPKSSVSAAGVCDNEACYHCSSLVRGSLICRPHNQHHLLTGRYRSYHILSCTALAKRVAAERAEEVGDVVGYSIG